MDGAVIVIKAERVLEWRDSPFVDNMLSVVDDLGNGEDVKR